MIPEDPYGEIQMLVSQLPDSAGTIVAKSKEFRESNEIDLAFTLLERAVAKDPAPVLLIERADLLAAEGDTEGAVDEARRAFQAGHDTPYAREVLSRALLGGLPDSEGQLATVANEFAEEGEIDYAEELLREGAERLPKSILIREQLAQLYAGERRLSDCIVELQEILALDPEHDDAQLMLAAALLKEGDLPGAQKLLDKARRRGVDSPVIEAIETRIAKFVQVISEAKSGDG